MEMLQRITIFCILVSFGLTLQAQDTLPSFSAVNRNGKVILSWINSYPVIKQLSIQRSSDSLKGFKTILTLPDPSSVTNGFLDNNSPNDSSYYKLYILLEGGKYIFSKSQKPHPYQPPVVKRQNQQPKPAEQPASSVPAPGGSQVSGGAPSPGSNNTAVTNATDRTYQVQTALASPAKKKSDTRITDSVNAVRPATFTPSGFVFTNADGNVTIVIPPGKIADFKIKFYESNGNVLFQIERIKEHHFTIDKSNFFHSGWFSFELIEDGILKEKNKVWIP